MTTVLFGAGKTGRDALKQDEFKNKQDIFLCDNFSALDNIDGVEIIDFSVLKKIYDAEKQTEVIITTACCDDIYRQCLESNIKIKGVYDENSKKVKSYNQYCLDKKIGYMNDLFFDYMDRKDHKVKEQVCSFLEGKPLSECITEVAIMISNICNYSIIHKKCPASLCTEKEIMSADHIKSIVDALRQIGFSGTICFHIYNEPMNDPRLFMIIRYVKEQLRDVTVEIYTNGFYLNNVMTKELADIGVGVLITTAYGDAEYQRLMKLEVPMAYRVFYGMLDDRLINYDKKESKKEEGICRSLISQVSVYVNGDIGLCCLDYRHDYGFGNVFEEGFVPCIDKKIIREFQLDLLNGKRSYKICQCCGWVR